MATNRELITAAFRKIGYGTNVESSVLDDALVDFKNMVWGFEENIGPLGYNDDSTLDDDSGLPKNLSEAVISLFAMRQAESIAIPVTTILAKHASAGMQTLTKYTNIPMNWVKPKRMPRGSGNTKRNYYDRDRYYNGDRVVRVVDGALVYGGAYLVYNGSYLVD